MINDYIVFYEPRYIPITAQNQPESPPQLHLSRCLSLGNKHLDYNIFIMIRDALKYLPCMAG